MGEFFEAYGPIFVRIEDLAMHTGEEAIERLREDLQRVYPVPDEWTFPADRRITLPFLRRYTEELTRETSKHSFRVYRVHQEVEFGPHRISAR
jgi:hypothetical protein